MLQIHGNISAENYRKIVESAFAHSDAAMMVYSTDGYDREDEERIMEKRAMLMPYILHTRNNSECTPENPDFCWPGTTSGYLDPLDPAAVFFYENMREYADTYELTDFVKDFILSVDGFYNWTHRCGNPEDLSFFKDGYCWMFVTAHEGEIRIYEHEDEFISLFNGMQLQYWIHVAPKPKLFYEPYPVP